MLTLGAGTSRTAAVAAPARRRRVALAAASAAATAGQPPSPVAPTPERRCPHSAASLSGKRSEMTPVTRPPADNFRRCVDETNDISKYTLHTGRGKSGNSEIQKPGRTAKLRDSRTFCKVGWGWGLQSIRKCRGKPISPSRLRNTDTTVHKKKQSRDNRQPCRIFCTRRSF